jgi:hypothetical protein
MQLVSKPALHDIHKILLMIMEAVFSRTNWILMSSFARVVWLKPTRINKPIKAKDLSNRIMTSFSIQRAGIS